MSLQSYRAQLIFCEGDHDVVLVRLLLKEHFNFSEPQWKFSEYPAPLNSYFPNRLQAHTANDLQLGLAHDFFLPNNIFIKEDRLVIVFKTGGETRTEALKKFLTDFSKAQRMAEIFPSAGGKPALSVISDVGYLFLYDADDMGLIGKKEFAFQLWENIGGEKWLDTPWETHPSYPLAAVCGAKSIYIWSANGATGTLEDLLYPAFAKDQPMLIEPSEKFAEQLWGKPEQSAAAQAKHKKAIMTVAGQGKKPGLGWHLILKESKLIKTKTILAEKEIADFASFLGNILV